MKKTTFALFFGNRGFFPGELIADARQSMIAACEAAGYGYIVMDEALTRYGAVETNCSLSVLLREMRRELEDKISAILFD